jgi:hypothetical protein
MLVSKKFKKIETEISFLEKAIELLKLGLSISIDDLANQFALRMRFYHAYDLGRSPVYSSE